MSSEDWFSEQHATFGDRLAGAREDAGMEQKTLSKRLGVKLSTLRNWEEDLAEPRANKLSMLSGLLGVSLTWLLTGQGEGVDPPGTLAEIPEDMTAILSEIRVLRTQSATLTTRLGLLEKRLRTALEQTG
ncbi:multiprotein-bridging factor 1 family protein [Aestuariibius sp. HNIBRBA575]|uniref:helix-turn-helix domain-containing protein n=1 Tax=Aestuariibius sp. HNIBRBA575 TaxID=3233343 RepID=UPI0034A234A0